MALIPEIFNSTKLFKEVDHFLTYKRLDELIQLGEDLNTMGEALVRVERAKGFNSF